MCNCKSYCSIILFTICTNCWGVSMIPSSPTNSSGGDDVRARDGTSCHQGTHVGSTMDFGVSGGQSTTQNNNNMQSNNTGNYQNNNNGGDIGLYARVIVPLGDGPPRVDCTSLYNLEIERLTMEIEKLKKSGSSTVTVE